MPIYEYNCQKCGTFEIIQSMNDNELQICPTCGECVQKQLSLTGGVIFKGDGFYYTDYKQKKQNKTKDE